MGQRRRIAQGLEGHRHGRASLLATVVIVASLAHVTGAGAQVAPVRIMPLGDSITEGGTVAGGYRDSLENRLVAGRYSFDFVGSQVSGPATLADRHHEGRPGFNIAQLSGVVPGALAANPPDVVLLMIGTNDMGLEDDYAGAPNRLRDLVDQIVGLQPTARVVVATIVPSPDPVVDQRIRTFNASIPSMAEAAVAQGKRVSWVDVHGALSLTDIGADRVHPTTAGQAKIAAVWYAKLQSLLGPPPASTTTSSSPGPTTTRPPGPTTTTTRAPTTTTRPPTTTTTVAPPPSACPCSIWSPSATPQQTTATGEGPVEVGLKFRSDVAGSISGVRFYKAPGDGGTHRGRLWTTGGTLLGDVAFGPESASGWQQVSFASPVAITANTTYVVSYYSPAGGFAYNPSYFATSGVDRPPLHAPANGAVSGGNGVYRFGAGGGFPTATYQSHNYWVDVVLTTGGGPPPPPPPTTTTTTAPLPSACPCSIWAPSATPQQTTATGEGPVEVGLKFRSDVAGSISGVRFYKAPGDGGTHRGRLWTTGGTLLGDVAFGPESASGWQQVSFASPVAITANTTYVVSYYSPAGGFAYNPSYFATSGVDRPPLHAPANGAVSGGNGVYRFGAGGGFPTATYQSHNYWVDVVFRP